MGQLFAEQQMVAADGRLRKMISLPEKWVYGWLFSIRSDSDELLDYKLTCYNILYDHFHGTIIKRLQTLQVRSQTDIDVDNCELALKGTQEYADLQKAKARKKKSVKVLEELDDVLQHGQLGIFDDEPKQKSNEEKGES